MQTVADWILAIVLGLSFSLMFWVGFFDNLK
ncbi:hypothetical protein [Caudoviricetes sp.]|nr:hypothetical protein [Caudoviricetes sp.]